MFYKEIQFSKELIKEFHTCVWEHVIWWEISRVWIEESHRWNDNRNDFIFIYPYHFKCYQKIFVPDELYYFGFYEGPLAWPAYYSVKRSRVQFTCIKFFEILLVYSSEILLTKQMSCLFGFKRFNNNIIFSFMKYK